MDGCLCKNREILNTGIFLSMMNILNQNHPGYPVVHMEFQAVRPAVQVHPQVVPLHLPPAEVAELLDEDELLEDELELTDEPLEPPDEPLDDPDEPCSKYEPST